MSKKVELLVSVIIAAVIMFVAIMIRPIGFTGEWGNIILGVLGFLLLVYAFYKGEKTNSDK